MKKTPDKKANANNVFDRGPARDIIPFCFLFMLPFIHTAPGAARTNPTKLISIASISMVLFALNSARQ